MAKRVYYHRSDLSVDVVAETVKGVRYRYLLDVKLRSQPKGSGETACIVMQNPSEANQEKADKSVKFLENYFFEKRFPRFSAVSRLLIVNQFARVKTNNFQGKPSDIGAENDKYIQKAISKSDLAIIAWGSSNTYCDRQVAIKAFLKKRAGLRCYQTTKHPRCGEHSSSYILRVLL
ncbi:MAG: DUF1643 domain-containing protein [Lacipirellulaceae bacterium]